jgi:murein DD-endopeptidase MepM/ murein hydrolase activator NlpD
VIPGLVAVEAKRRFGPLLVRLAIAAALVLPLVGLLALVASLGGSTASTGASAAVSCTLPVDEGAPAAVGSLDEEQTANARVIIAVGQEMKVPARGWAIGIATAMQESGLRNLDHGHGTSVGLFQLIDDHGTVAERIDPVFSSRWFFRGLLAVDGWQEMPLTEAAQAVQRSLYPMAYARWETLAEQTVARLTGQDAGVCAPLATGPWTLPLPPGSYTISSRYEGGYRSTGGHSGLDFAAPGGTPIFAASSGRVRSAGPGGAYGNLVIIEHADGVTTYYAHQCDGCIRVAAGDPVEPGTPIGAVGNTGNTYGASGGYHLHFEVRVQGQMTDPEPWLTQHGVDY